MSSGKQKAGLKMPDLFGLLGLDKLPEPSLDVSHLATATEGLPEFGEIPSLEGKRKALFVVGAGNAGKTMFLRWACEKPRSPWALLTVDPVNRELLHYFPNVASPPAGMSTQTWLWKALDAFMADPEHSVAIDFGGGDTALPGVARELPDLVRIMEGSGLHPVLLVMLTPRVTDLTALLALAEAGFQPRTTALVMNLGRGDDINSFRAVLAHSAARQAQSKGAAVLYMSRLFGAGPAIEQRRISFSSAVADDSPLSLLDRGRVFDWLRRMDVAFEPIRSWLP